MALIKCSKCGKKISNKASKCIHCGCPIKEKKETNNKKSNTLSNKTIVYTTIIVLIIIVVIIISGLLGSGTSSNKNSDTNEIKMVCNYNAYDFQEKIDGYNHVLLNGNSKSTKITTHEKRRSMKKYYNCKTILKDIVEKYGNNTYCTDDFSGSGSEYKLLYIYDVNEDINKKANELKEQNYKCLTYYNKNDSVVNNNIIGAWCGKQETLSDSTIFDDVKFIFNEDGTGKYFNGEYINENIFYEVNSNNIINYAIDSESNYTIINSLTYNREKNIISNDGFLPYKLSKCD